MAKRKKWIKPRHRIIQAIAKVVLWPVCRIKYGIKIEKFKEQEDRPYLILYNHQTAFDQFFMGISFKGPIYYVATEDIFSMGFVSDLLRFAVNPIPIKKQTTDVGAVMNCLRVAKEGGTICLAPEGNRTYSGKTEYINPAIVSLAKKLKLPIALYRIEGGYGVQPRWSDRIRKGKMRSYVSEVIKPEEFSAMTDEELAERINKGLFVDEGKADAVFESDFKAEYMERAVYVCPFCGLSEFESHGNETFCKTCGKTVTYGEDKRITGKGFDFPFEFFGQWYDYQKDFVNGLDLNEYTEKPLFCDDITVKEVIIRKNKKMLRESAKSSLYGNRIVVDEGTEKEWILPFSELSAVSVLGKNKLNVYSGSEVFQITGSKRFNALKYVNIYYRWKNIKEGNIDGKFLGL
ncbi:MAG: 1-acyl-sn-glycerol-3-phosphate acyltransferase [Oscillospiraceae bacterium]|nr:1-acyl-sn-glycerol-3-phosphate acyltransferase [Oscillospiraceae bacterium]MBR6657448.1 1-acyl-sn-glycerol-3-phosphate acyltransferase [Oscillospiraceae bacterium]